MNLFYFECLEALCSEITLSTDRLKITLSPVGVFADVTVNIANAQYSKTEYKKLVDILETTTLISEISVDKLPFINLKFKNEFWQQQLLHLFDKVIRPENLPLKTSGRVGFDLSSKVFLAQYAVARCCSILRANKWKNERISMIAQKRPQFVFIDSENNIEISLIKRLSDWPRLCYASKNGDMCKSKTQKSIKNYLGLLAADFEVFWQKMVKEAKNSKNEANLALFAATACIITEALANIDIIAFGEIKEQIERI